MEAPYIAKLQALQSESVSQLTALYNQAKADYHATHMTKKQVAQEYLPKITALQNSLQDQVNGLLYSLRAALLQYGYSTQEVNTLRQEYQQAVAKADASFH